MPTPQPAIYTYQKIADFFGWSLSKTKKYSAEWLKEGIIFKCRLFKAGQGARPPLVGAFPDTLREWAMKQGKEGRVL